MDAADELRSKTFASLHALGFQPAECLRPDLETSLRPAIEIASRLRALDALYVWVVEEEGYSAAEVNDFVERNDLKRWLSPTEVRIIELPRPVAHERHINTIGWKLENMWALAWVLGFSSEPDLRASQIEHEVTEKLFAELLPDYASPIEDEEHWNIRPLSDVQALEFRFYSAHNAVRNAQLGRAGVPVGFHPLIHGGAVSERRHALKWCLSPCITWDDTDTST
jgi:hypothetical protein